MALNATIHEFVYADYNSYARSADPDVPQPNVWNVYNTLVANNPGTVYTVELSVGAQGIDFVQVDGPGDIRDAILRHQGITGSAQLRDFVRGEGDPNDQNNPFQLNMRIMGPAPAPVLPQPRRNPGRNRRLPARFDEFEVRFRANGSFHLKHLSENTHCVLNHITRNILYFKQSGERRECSWAAPAEEGADPVPVPAAEVEERLHQDKTLLGWKKAVRALMSEEGVRRDGLGAFAFDWRHLLRLAELSNHRIRVVVSNSIGRFSVVFDTIDDVKPRPGIGRVFTFCMCNSGHLKGVTRTVQKNPHRDPGFLWNPTDHVAYLSDWELQQLLQYAGVPEEERPIYGYGFVHPSFLGPESRRTDLQRLRLTDGVKTYYHESMRELHAEIQAEVFPEGLDAPNVPLLCSSWASAHSHAMQREMRECNIYPMSQSKAPRAFCAVGRADKMTCHTSYGEAEGQQVYECDFKAFYATEFGELPPDEFPWFHGYPANACFDEYCGPVGTMDRCAPFTFARSGRYAVFEVDRIDVSRCRSNFVKHLRRDGLFLDELRPEGHLLYLCSPVLHFLQDRGASWRASRVWVCHGTTDTWAPDTPRAKRVRRGMLSRKTYPFFFGKLMSGRDPSRSENYIVPDAHTAAVIVNFFKPPNEGEGFLRYLGSDRVSNPALVNYDADGTCVTVATPSVADPYMHESLGGASGFGVRIQHDMWGRGQSHCHISGAQHAYAFCRLYDAVRRLAPAEVTGFSLDSVRCKSDPTEHLSLFVREEPEPGYLKPAEAVRVKYQPGGRRPLLTELWTPAKYTRGVQEPVPHPDCVKWSRYHDSLGGVNLVTGPAGSGKTSRHFASFEGRADKRLCRDNTYFCTLTNFLTRLKAREFGCHAMTSHKLFRRRPNDQQPSVGDRYKRKRRGQGAEELDSETVDLSTKCSTVFMDEVTMMDPLNLADAVQVCRENHMRLFLSGDFDPSTGRIFQLIAPAQTQEAYRQVLCDPAFTRVPQEPVYRQSEDPGLEELLTALRGCDRPEDSWRLVRAFPFRRASYEEALAESDPARDFVVINNHQEIRAFHVAKLGPLPDGAPVRVRSTWSDHPKRGATPLPDFLEGLGTPMSNGSTAVCSVGQLRRLDRGPLMKGGYPYSPPPKGQGGSQNKVNAAAAVTPYFLQGTTLNCDSRVYLVVSDLERPWEWLGVREPRFLYVVLSRARTRGQVVIAQRQTGPSRGVCGPP